MPLLLKVSGFSFLSNRFYKKGNNRTNECRTNEAALNDFWNLETEPLWLLGLTNNDYNFTSGNASSNFGDAMQYKFDWGDGSDSGWLATGTTGAAHTWTTSGTYQVRVMARTKKTNMESSWSTVHDIIIADAKQDKKADQ